MVDAGLFSIKKALQPSSTSGDSHSRLVFFGFRSTVSRLDVYTFEYGTLEARDSDIELGVQWHGHRRSRSKVARSKAKACDKSRRRSFRSSRTAHRVTVDQGVRMVQDRDQDSSSHHDLLFSVAVRGSQLSAAGCAGVQAPSSSTPVVRDSDKERRWGPGDVAHPLRTTIERKTGE